MTPALQARAASLQAEFDALPLEADGSTRLPPALRREIVDLALDVLAGPESRAKAGAPEILRILTRWPVIVCGWRSYALRRVAPRRRELRSRHHRILDRGH